MRAARPEVPVFSRKILEAKGNSAEFPFFRGHPFDPIIPLLPHTDL
eukprot:COSAG04_NODE_4472_length_2068_cov_2.128999_3_plen_45_part_01